MQQFAHHYGSGRGDHNGIRQSDYCRTLARVAYCCGYSDEVQVVEALYMRGAKACLRVITDWADEWTCGMVIGHNPDVSSLVQLLTGVQVELATAAIAVIQVPVDHWAAIETLPICKLVEILS